MILELYLILFYGGVIIAALANPTGIMYALYLFFIKKINFRSSIGKALKLWFKIVITGIVMLLSSLMLVNFFQ